LAYLLSKPDLTAQQVRKLITQPLRGELTPVSPVPTYSSPDTQGRLRSLFTQVIACSPVSQRRPASPAHKTAFLPDDTAPPPVEVPDELAVEWPSTLADEEAIESAILPYLLGQAASRTDDLLSSLLDTHQSRLPSLLNEPTSASLETPLHLAILANRPRNVDLLLSHGASVHVRDAHGHSPLFLAAKIGGTIGLEMVKGLRAAGAHLGNLEIDSGEVGMAVMRMEKSRKEGEVEVWKEAGGEETLEKAKKIAIGLFSS